MLSKIIVNIVFYFFLVSFLLATDDNISVRIIPQLDGIHSLTTKLKVGILFNIKKPWHIYANNPGESGRAPNIKFIDEVGTTVSSSIEWMYPESLFDLGIQTYVYKQNAFLIAELSLPKVLFHSKQSLFLKAIIDWAECSNVCINRNTTIPIEIPIEECNTDNPHFIQHYKQYENLYPIKNLVRATANLNNSLLHLSIRI